jgi:predicted aspartyl protease
MNQTEHLMRSEVESVELLKGNRAMVSLIAPAATPSPSQGIIPLRSSEVVNISETRGWLAPVYVNGVLMMLAVDTGATMTIVNSEKFLKLLDRALLQPSEHTFHTAAGITLPALGQFVRS